MTDTRESIAKDIMRDPIATYARCASATWAKKLESVPPGLWGGMVNYILLGHVPGSFLTALFEGDLFGAYASADDESRRAIPDLVMMIANAAPAGCYGSRDRFAHWAAIGGMLGR